MDDSVEMATKVNRIINNVLTQKLGYKFYLETKLMKKFELRYPEDFHVEDLITRMIVTEKYEPSKVIHKQAERTHQNTLIWRYHNEAENVKKLGAKNILSFCINDRSYTDDKSIYD